MNNSTSNTESKTDTTTNQTATNNTTGYEEANNSQQAAPTESPAEESTTDEFGYEKTLGTENKKPVETKKDEPKEDEKPVEKPATGYGEDTKEDKPKEDEKPVEKEVVELTEADKVKKEFEEVIKDLDQTFDKEKITKFALEHKLSKDQLAAYVKLTKQENAEYVKRQEQAVKEQRAKWKNELKNDPEFGGENFIKNVDRVEKLLEKYLPDTKKVLTERRSVLPPYIMRDFLRLAKALNPTTKLVTGEASEPKKEESNFLDEMYS